MQVAGRTLSPSHQVAQRKGDGFLRVAHPVHGGGVDPIDAQLQRAMNRGDRGFIVLFASAKFPTCPTDCPGSEADGCDGQV